MNTIFPVNNHSTLGLERRGRRPRARRRHRSAGCQHGLGYAVRSRGEQVLRLRPTAAPACLERRSEGLDVLFDAVSGPDAQNTIGHRCVPQSKAAAVCSVLILRPLRLAVLPSSATPSAKTFVLTMIGRNQDGTTSMTTSVPCDAGSSSEVCMLQVRAEFPLGSLRWGSAEAREGETPAE